MIGRPPLPCEWAAIRATLGARRVRVDVGRENLVPRLLTHCTGSLGPQHLSRLHHRAVDRRRDSRDQRIGTYRLDWRKLRVTCIVAATSARSPDAVHGTSRRFLNVRSGTRRWGRAVALTAVVLIGVATLRGSGDTVPPPWCLPCALRNPGLASDAFVNVLLFVPLGVGLRLAGLPVWAVVAAGLAVSLCVEALQAYVIPGRVANVADLVTNTVGAAAAAIATLRWRTAVFPSARKAMSLTLLSTSGLVAIVGATAWALSPAVARAPLSVRGVDRRDSSMPPERVLSATVDRSPVRSRETVPAPGVHARPINVEVVLQASRARWLGEPGLALVADDDTLLWLGIDHDELELEVRRKGEAARFHSPSLRLPRPALEPESAATEALDTLWLRAVAGGWRMRVTAQTPRSRDDLEMRLHALSGWALIVPTPRSRWLAELLTVLWTSALFFPVAYWSVAASARRSRLLIVAVLSMCVAGVWAAGAAAGAPVPPRSAIVAAFVAAFVAAIGRWGLDRTIKPHDHVPSAA